MFCSATPALMYCFGQARRNSSKSAYPWSPVSRTTRASAIAASTNARANAFRMRVSNGNALQLGKRRVVRLHRQTPVMPAIVVLHKRHALAFHGVRDDGSWPWRTVLGQFDQPCLECRLIVTVYFSRLESEGSEFLPDGAQPHDFCC